MTSNIHLKSKDAGSIFINGHHVGVIDNIITHYIDLKVYSNKLTITKEPISNNKKLLLPYTVQIEISNNKVTTLSDYVEVIPFKDGAYDVILQSCHIKSHKQMEKVFDDFIENYNVVVVNDGLSYINLYHMNVVKQSITTQEITNISTQYKNGYIIIKGITANNKNYLLALNEKDNFNIVFNHEVEKLEESTSRLKAIKKINDIAGHAKVISINFESGQSQSTASNTESQPTQSTFYVYLNNEALLCQENKLVPYAFLEALMVQNYKLAKSYLTPELSVKTSDAHLKKYFQNLSAIHYNCHNSISSSSCIETSKTNISYCNNNTLNYTVLCDTYKNFDFSVANGKIIDIEEKLI